MGAFGRTALLCGVSLLAVPAFVTSAQAQAATARSTHSFNIPPKPLLVALADFTAQTGIQVVRPSAQRVSGTSQGVSGQYSAEAALRIILAGSGLSFQATGPRTISLYAAGGGDETGFIPAGDAIVLEPIDVSGTASPNERAFSGVGRVEISSEDLALKNPRNLQEVFAGEPGVSVGSSIPMSQKVYVHGVEETNLAVTIDGSRQNNKIFHHNATNLIDPTLLKSVEVDAGVATADGGPGALAGSIAYETKDARDLLLPGKDFGGFASLSFDTNSNTVTTGVSAYGVQDGFEALGYVNIGKGDNFEDGSGREVIGSEADFLSGIGKLAYEAESGDRFEFSHESIKDDADRPFRANMQDLETPPWWQPQTRPYDLQRQNTVFSYTDTTPEGLWDPKLVIAYSQTELETTSYWCPNRPCAGGPTLYPATGKTDSFNGKFENKFALAFGSVTAGVDFYNDRVKLEAVSPSVDDTGDEKATNIGVYAQARLEPWERTRLSFGMRGDHQWFEGTDGSEFDNGGLSGNVSAEYDLTSFLTAKAGYSHIWAGIPLAESFIMNPTAWDYGAGGPDPVTADNVVASLVARYNGFTFEGGVFKTRIHDARTAVYADALSNHEFESEGFELGAGYEWESGFFRVKYANIEAKIDGVTAVSEHETPSGGYIFNTYLGVPVGEIITLQLVQRFDDWGLTVGGNVEIALEYPDTAVDDYSKGLPGYEVVNVFAEWVPQAAPNLTLRGEINNVFDETYSDRASYGGDSIWYAPLHEPGRSFLLSAKAQF